jgi:Uncharacterized protein conserved in bacteria (DUF2188)
MAKGDVHTVHRDGRWFNEVEGGSRASNSADTKAEAQAKGRDMARRRKVEHLIHDKNGRIVTRNSYGSDPRRSKG